MRARKRNRDGVRRSLRWYEAKGGEGAGERTKTVRNDDTSSSSSRSVHGKWLGGRGKKTLVPAKRACCYPTAERRERRIRREKERRQRDNDEPLPTDRQPGRMNFTSRSDDRPPSPPPSSSLRIPILFSIATRGQRDNCHGPSLRTSSSSKRFSPPLSLSFSFSCTLSFFLFRARNGETPKWKMSGHRDARGMRTTARVPRPHTGRSLLNDYRKIRLRARALLHREGGGGGEGGIRRRRNVTPRKLSGE